MSKRIDATKPVWEGEGETPSVFDRITPVEKAGMVVNVVGPQGIVVIELSQLDDYKSRGYKVWEQSK